MFDKIWFLKHQNLLLKFANTLIGRYILRINGKRSSVEVNKIIQILPSSITWKEGKYYKSEFRSSNKFANRIYYAFKPFWHLLHLWDMTWYPNFNLGFDTLTQYPESTGSRNPVNGRLYRGGVNQLFSDIRIGAGTNAEPDVTNGECALLRATSTSNQYQILLRSIFCFNTASLTSSAIISAATFSLCATGQAPVTNEGTTTLDIVASSPSSTTDLATSDYGQLASTVFGSKTVAAWVSTDGTYNDITLDANGIANISKTSISKFGTRLGFDTIGSGQSWVSLGDSTFYCYFAAQSGTTKDPKLVVTYSLPVKGYAFFM
jgi:hypothetical protein